MVSLLGKTWLSQMLPRVSTLSLEQFMGVSDLNLRTANNTGLSLEIDLIDFALKPNTENVSIPTHSFQKGRKCSVDYSKGC